MPKKKKVEKQKENKSKKASDPLEAIKRLLVLQLYKDDISTKEIGAILDVSYKTIERMIPTSVKRNKKQNKKKNKRSKK